MADKSFFFVNFSKGATEFRFQTGTRVVTGNALKKAGSVRGLQKRCTAAKWDSHSEVEKKRTRKDEKVVVLVTMQRIQEIQKIIRFFLRRQQSNDAQWQGSCSNYEALLTSYVPALYECSS